MIVAARLPVASTVSAYGGVNPVPFDVVGPVVALEDVAAREHVAVSVFLQRILHAM